MKIAIQTDKAPTAIGPYSKGIKVGNTVYISGQIPIDPFTNELVRGDIAVQVTRAFENLRAIAEAAHGNLDSIVRVCVYLTDLSHFQIVNDAMIKYFNPPYPARSIIGVNALPKNVSIEIDAVMVIDE